MNVVVDVSVEVVVGVCDPLRMRAHEKLDVYQVAIERWPRDEITVRAHVHVHVHDLDEVARYSGFSGAHLNHQN